MIVDPWGIWVLAVAPTVLGVALGFVVGRAGAWTMIDAARSEADAVTRLLVETQAVMRNADFLPDRLDRDPDDVRSEVRDFWVGVLDRRDRR